MLHSPAVVAKEQTSKNPHSMVKSIPQTFFMSKFLVRKVFPVRQNSLVMKNFLS